MSELETIKPSLQSYNLVGTAIIEELSGEESNMLLKDAWINLGNQLIIEGIPEEQISSVATKLLLEKKAETTNLPKEELKMSGYFYRVYNSEGWTNSFYARNANEEQSVTLGEQENTSIKQNAFEQENKSWISSIERLEDFLKLEKTKLKNNHFDSLVPQKQSNQILLTINSIIDHCHDRLNKKTKIPLAHHPILLRDVMTASGTLLSQKYYEHVMEKEVFTTKTVSKIVRCIMKDVPFRYEPTNKDQAEACGFSGVSCPNCDNFRTEYVPGIKIIEVKDSEGRRLKNKKTGEILTQTIGIRRIHCYKEDLDYDAPMPACLQ